MMYNALREDGLLAEGQSRNFPILNNPTSLDASPTSSVVRHLFETFQIFAGCVGADKETGPADTVLKRQSRRADAQLSSEEQESPNLRPFERPRIA